MNADIEASFETLFTQAQESASSYLQYAKTEIDRVFGDGHAKNHPELVAAFMKCASNEFCSGSTSKVMQSALKGIGYSLDSIAAALKNE